MRLLKLPEYILELISEGKISAAHGRTVITIDDEEARKNLCSRIVKEGLSVRETERLAAEISVLLKHQGLLEDFVSLARKAESGGNGSVLFRDVFLAASEKELEYQLRSMPEFSALRTADQQEVLRRAREIRAYFMKTDRHTR